MLVDHRIQRSSYIEECFSTESVYNTFSAPSGHVSCWSVTDIKHAKYAS